jgi:hypothetical protein
VGRISSMPSSAEAGEDRPREKGEEGRIAAVENIGRAKSARSSSNRVASHEIVLEMDILLHRLLHLTTPREEDSEQKRLLRIAREVYDGRRIRERIFGSGLFADPSWDILLDLYIARREDRKVTVSSACIAASSPTTTATRHISHLVQTGLVVRVPHPCDARSSYLELSAKAETKLTRLFKEMEQAGEDRV